jgi:hypothetical protein
VLLRPARIRVWITWGVAALFAAVFVCGESIHFLPGFGHFSHCCHEHSRHCLSCGGSVSAERVFVGSATAGHRVIGESECAICNFLAQVHCLPMAPVGAGESRQTASQDNVAGHLVLSEFAGVYHSRAPPA